ncbi:MAG: LLM class flavin-dependent oxidoreductase, partial [Alphaproteobacteria bacterium]|nr:LLM class flavin-dependent oxidoreductase [Alphaproteobacteria bacterium]
WISYVVTPEMFQQSLDRIRGEAEAAGREAGPFGTGHLLFACVDDSYETALDKATETLSVRYAMDFREAARKYCALGRPEDVAERLVEFHGAGVRHVVMDFVGPYEERDRQFERFAREVLPLMADYR